MIASRLPVLASLLGLAVAAGCARQDTPPPAAATGADAHGRDHDHDHGSGEAHADHAARHGGVFFMAPDGWHHLEGTWEQGGVFRVRLYDDHTRPLPAAGASGRVRRDEDPEDSGLPLAFDADTGTLFARFEPQPALPIDLVLMLTLRDPATSQDREHRFDFRFESISTVHVAPGATHAHASPHGGQVVDTAEGHLELGTMGGMFALWVLDGEMKTLPVEGTEVVLMVQEPGGTRELRLAGMGDHFMSSERVPEGAATVVARVTREGRTVLGRFEIGGQ